MIANTTRRAELDLLKDLEEKKDSTEKWSHSLKTHIYFNKKEGEKQDGTFCRTTIKKSRNWTRFC